MNCAECGACKECLYVCVLCINEERSKEKKRWEKSNNVVEIFCTRTHENSTLQFSILLMLIRQICYAMQRRQAKKMPFSLSPALFSISRLRIMAFSYEYLFAYIFKW